MNQNYYRNLIAAKDSSLSKSILRVLLSIIAAAYRAVVFLRNRFYDLGWARSYRADAIVISIGNITTGGTGKTPLVIWLCALLQKHSLPCAILTRGYKVEQGKFTDEPALLAKACPDAKVIVDADRVNGAKRSVNNHGAKVLVMDDGFQHRRLKRDIDIVAIDATCPFGYGRILPAGLLRESIKGLKRAHAIVITRYDQATTDDMNKLEQRIKQIVPGIPIAKANHVSRYAKAIKGEVITLEKLRTKKIFAFCGIGNPQAFVSHLKTMGLNIVGSKFYNDHYDFTKQDINDISEEARYLDADLVLATQKDWIKTVLLMKENEGVDFAYLGLELEFIEGRDKIEQLVDSVIKETITDSSDMDTADV
ncbi:MAG: tetraacyldisaccharide 4'-kinase [Anaerohalosphaera sp.]|nr:tetraacyldisaccharide 4'-kinase [Anaerohalosphaera sp.]